MSRLSGSLGRPIQGISQQPNKVRLDGQCSESVNFSPDIVKGLVSRVGSDFMYYFDESITSDDLIHTYQRSDQRFIVIVKAGTGEVRVYTLEGQRVTCSAETTATSYLAGATKDTLRALTIADTTFIVNTSKVVQAATTSSAASDNRGIVYCQFADYAQTYQIIIDGSIVAEHTTPDGSDTSHKAYIDTTYVATQLKSKLDTSLGSTYTINRDGNSIYLYRNDGADYTMKTVDGADGGNLITVKGSVSDVSKLPAYAPPDFKVSITPTGGTDAEVYYLVATLRDGSTDIFWKETIGYEVCTGLMNSSMPMALRDVSTSDDSLAFSLEVVDWEERAVGDEDTNTDPSFLDTTIDSVGLFQNRLYFTAGESISMTRSNDFYNFYRVTTQTITDSDPVDFYSDVAEVVNFKASVAFAGDVVFFSERHQFTLSGEDVVTPNSLIPLRLLSSFENQSGVNPVAGGDSVFFPFSYGEYTGIREIFIDSMVDTKRARPITDQVKQLMYGTAEKLAASTSLDKLVVKCVGNETLYIYDWIWQGSEKVQSAWGKWTMPLGVSILDFFFSESYFYLVVNDTEGSHLLKMDMGDPPEGYGLDFGVRMDYKVAVTATRQDDNTWSFTNPLSLPLNMLKAIAGTGAFEENIGTEVPLDTLTSFEDELLADADTEEVTIIIGTPISCLYTPSNPYPKDSDGTARTDLERLQVASLYVNYDSSGIVNSTVIRPWGTESYKVLYPRVVGSYNNVVGFAPLGSDKHTIPIRARSTEYTATIDTSSHIPLQIREIEYSGSYRPRGRFM